MDINLLIATIFSYGSQGNLILFVIIGCSIISLTIFLERLMLLRRSESDTNQLIIAMRQTIKEGNLVEAARICEETGGTIATIIKAGILKHQRSQEHIESAMETAGLVEIARLERNAKVLSIIAHISPLIGLLGTVLGFIQAFSEMRQSGLVDISATRIGEAMEYALVTTAAGLVVAIPSLLAYNYLVSRIEDFVLEIRTTSHEVINLLLERQEER